LDLIISLLAFILVLLVSGNNLAICVGTVIAGGIVRQRTALLLAIAGYLLGLLVQGSLLSFGFYAIMPAPTYAFIAIALLISILAFVAGHFMRVSLSLSVTFAAALLGISLAAGEAVNIYFIALMVAFWIIAPLASLIMADLSMRASPVLRRRKRVWNVLSGVRLLLLVASFLAAFTLGANTLGLVYASVKAYTSIYVLALAVIVGCLATGRGEIRRLGSEIVSMRYLNALVSQLVSVVFAEGATLASVPLSSTQTFAASVYGAGLSYKTNLFMKRTVNALLLTWVTAAVGGLVLGYLFTALAVAW
jgi:inorganic phosphate transporter, PiT family